MHFFTSVPNSHSNVVPWNVTMWTNCPDNVTVANVACKRTNVAYTWSANVNDERELRTWTTNVNYERELRTCGPANVASEFWFLCRTLVQMPHCATWQLTNSWSGLKKEKKSLCTIWKSTFLHVHTRHTARSIPVLVLVQMQSVVKARFEKR